MVIYDRVQSRMIFLNTMRNFEEWEIQMKTKKKNTSKQFSVAVKCNITLNFSAPTLFIYILIYLFLVQLAGKGGRGISKYFLLFFIPLLPYITLLLVVSSSSLVFTHGRSFKQCPCNNWWNKGRESIKETSRAISFWHELALFVGSLRRLKSWHIGHGDPRHGAASHAIILCKII